MAGTRTPAHMTWALLLSVTAAAASQWISYSPAACGCVADSTHYPTAALSQMAYGSSTDYGPACGKCFQLTLLNPVIANPPFKPNVTKSVVVKIIDLCPFSADGLCGATAQKPNSADAFLNFDLAYPSSAIPDDFFPSDVALYGYSDFGIWNITYEEVSCTTNWAGGQDAAALGSVPSQGLDACCPADPTNSTNTCPSYSDQNGIPPNTAGLSAASTYTIPQYLNLVIGMVFIYTAL